MLRDEDIELVKSQVNMRMLAEYFGIHVNRAGFAICPFHNEKTGSMKVHSGYLSHDGYYCFGCGAGGTIFSFVMEYCNLDFEEAVRYIAAAFRIQIAGGKELSPEDKERVRCDMRKREIESKLISLQHKSLAALSERIRYYEMLQKSAVPYGGLYCFVTNRIVVLSIQWEQLMENLFDKGACEYG